MLGKGGKHSSTKLVLLANFLLKLFMNDTHSLHFNFPASTSIFLLFLPSPVLVMGCFFPDFPMHCQ